MAQFQFAASADAAKEPFFLYADEADRFSTDSVPDLYVRARKRNVHVTLATQFFKKLAPNTQDAVLETTGAFMIFKSGNETARSMASRAQRSYRRQMIG